MKLFSKIAITLLVIFLGEHCNGAKILGVFPYPSKSHHILGKTLLKELANRGHEVTMISAFPLKDPPKNYKDVTLHRVMEWKYQMMKKIASPNISVPRKLHIFNEALPDVVRTAFEEVELVEFLNSGQKFDVAITEAITEASLAIGHLVNATNVVFSIMGGLPIYNYHTGIPTPYAYVPSTFYIYNDKMTFYQRLVNSIVSFGLQIMIHFKYYPNQVNVLKEYYPNLSLDDIIRDVDLYLINSHYATESPRPHLTNTVQIGGFHLHEKEELPADIRSFIDGSKHGVILFSLGTNIQSAKLKRETIQQFISAFSKSKYDFLMKFEDDLPDLPRNIKISSWLPQKAILEHSATKAFITHGGLGSIAESVYFGVPIIAIPFFGDQKKNVADSLEFGFAIELNIATITESQITDAIDRITTDPKYLEKAQFRSDIYRNQEMDPMEKAVFWIEHVAKHRGAKHIKPMASELKWYQYMLLDVMALLIAVLAIILVAVNYAVASLNQFLCKKTAKIKTR